MQSSSTSISPVGKKQQQADHLSANTGAPGEQPGRPTTSSRPIVPLLILQAAQQQAALSASRSAAGPLPVAGAAPSPDTASSTASSPAPQTTSSRGGIKRALDGRDGPGNKDIKLSKRHRAASSGEHDERGRDRISDDRKTVKKLTRMQHENNLREKIALSPRQTPPGSPRSNASGTPPGLPGANSAQTDRSTDRGWRRSVHASKPELPTHSALTLSPRRASTGDHSFRGTAASGNSATHSSPAPSRLAALGQIDDSFSFAPCHIDEHGCIDVGQPLVAGAPSREAIAPSLAAPGAAVPGASTIAINQPPLRLEEGRGGTAVAPEMQTAPRLHDDALPAHAAPPRHALPQDVVALLDDLDKAMDEPIKL